MRIGIVVLALAVAGCGVWTSTPGNVGDCAAFTDMARDRSELSKVDCSAPEAMYKLVDTVSGRSPTCPRGDYVEDTSARNRKTERRTRKCFVLNVREGECLNPVGTSYSRVPCAGAPLKVSKVVTGQFDPALCGPGDDPKAYSRPALTICLGKG